MSRENLFKGMFFGLLGSLVSTIPVSILKTIVIYTVYFSNFHWLLPEISKNATLTIFGLMYFVGETEYSI